MKKNKRKLRLNRETLRSLEDGQLSEAGGGSVEYCTVVCTSICPRSENCPVGPSVAGCTGPEWTVVGCIWTSPTNTTITNQP